ncbi:hypothetical protein GCM10022399_20050 [Terrabacter ginsenosidimutans]|uniref:HTH cro/C1-type domain-containing protein n=1 Tax=Terrabacter ginsenosidimutans TaxID=490575 RepID=A0ABP7DBX6_9MICO
MTVTDQQIGKRVRERRERRDFSQAQVAAAMNVKGFHTWTKVIVSRVELGTRALKLREAQALCGDAILGCTLDELVAG